MNQKILYLILSLGIFLSILLSFSAPFAVVSLSLLSVLLSTSYRVLIGGCTTLLYLLLLLFMTYYQSTLPPYSILLHLLSSLLIIWWVGWKRREAFKGKEYHDQGYESFIEDLPTGFGRSMENGRILMANQALVSMLGYEDREDLLNVETLDTYVKAEDRERILKKIQEEGFIKGYELELKRKDGLRIWVSLSERSFQLGDKTYYDYSFEDITQRKRAQAELKESISLLRATIEATEDGILVEDLEGHILTYNQRFLDLWEIPHHLMETGDGESLFLFMQEKIKSSHGSKDEVEKYLSSREESSLDVLERKDGRIFERYTNPQRINDVVVGRVFSFRDKTEEKRALERLEEGEMEKATILNGLLEQVIHLDTDYRILWANREAREDDYYYKELVGARCYELWEEEGPCEGCPVTKTLTTGRDHEKNMVTKDGRSWNLRSYPIHDDKNELKGVIKIAEDITKKVATRRALEESEEKYRSLFENVFHGFSYCRVIKEEDEVVDYIYLTVNEAFARSVGLPKEEIEGKRATEIYPLIRESSFDWIGTYGEVARLREALTFEAYFESDGKWYRTHAFSYEKDYFGLLFDDITLLKKKEMELENTRNRLQVTLESIGDGVIATDREGHIQLMNDTAQRLTGWKAIEAKGRPLQDIFVIINEKTRARAENPVERVLKTGQVAGLANNTLLISRLGEERVISDSAAPITSEDGKIHGVVMVFRDTTKIRESEKRLQSSEERYRRTFDNTGTAMVIVEEDTTISLVNNKTMELFQLTREEMEGRSFLDFIHPEDRERMQEYHLKRRRGDKHIPLQYETRLLTPDGETRDTLLIVTYLQTTNQSIGSLIDITPIKMIEEELKSSKEKIVALHHVAMAMSRAIEEEEICHLIVKAAEDILCFYHSLVSLVEGDRLNIKEVSSNNPGYSTTSIPLEEGIMGETLQKGETIITPAIHRCTRAQPKLSNYRSGISVPIGDLGVFQAMSDVEDAFSKEDARMAELLTSHALEGLRRIRYQQKIRYLSFHDSLTGTYNRVFFEEELARLGKSRQKPLSIIMGDINGLKLVNDAFGHHVGDELLKRMTEILASSCRREDIIARWGGDEFIILLPHTSAKVADQICSRIKRRCSEDKKMPVPVTISLGRATREEEEMETFELIREAEDMMLKHKLIESQSVRSSILNTLLKTLKEKSNETEEHALRLQALALELGKRIHLSDAQLDHLSLLVSLHDIGKIVIPQRILEKKDKLTKDEWETIKTHSEIGYRIAISSEDFAHIAEEILAHHEWWDGSGYPRGLKEEDIPLNSRITSIVDAYDVMTNDRPYKKKKTREEAKEELLRCSGTQFDPDLVKAFICMLEEEE